MAGTWLELIRKIYEDLFFQYISFTQLLRFNDSFFFLLNKMDISKNFIQAQLRFAGVFIGLPVFWIAIVRFCAIPAVYGDAATAQTQTAGFFLLVWRGQTAFLWLCSFINRYFVKELLMPTKYFYIYFYVLSWFLKKREILLYCIFLLHIFMNWAMLINILSFYL